MSDEFKFKVGDRVVVKDWAGWPKDHYYLRIGYERAEYTIRDRTMMVAPGGGYASAPGYKAVSDCGFEINILERRLAPAPHCVVAESMLPRRDPAVDLLVGMLFGS